MGGGSSKKKSKVTQHDKAVLELKTTRDKLKQYQKQCDAVMTKETEAARTLMKQGKKKQALLAMKKKKYQETLLSKAESQLENIQTMIDSIEFAQVEVKVFESLKEGNKVLKDLHSQMKIEDVENLMMDTQEAIQHQQEIESILAESLTPEDNEAVEAELEKLELEGVESKLPSVPNAELPQVEKQAEPKAEKTEKTAQKQAQLA